ncbi:L-amino acid N-acyltransferase YncA/DNA-binding transcriptional ArsR family regulator [Crossiella equi]|uniref:L-amino acid N-acyltransferase YncA/DNA-binding transcriptional ArsR family regulator n=1 Tax=Crossiella equi TaxID=130796 RepID=A0ABS5A5X8_9PSEU|nr:GNAT family N-acetyltransferase [Crossiella equi]MBP2471998.1 L-amino acid N-acyltransferase YncA/DNA-binding transcriptional ArsR family regulator [Crossiella equi]
MTADLLARHFAALADPARVRLLHALAAHGARRRSELAPAVGLAPGECAEHVAALAEAGLVRVEPFDDPVVEVDPAGRAALPRMADLVLGLLEVRPIALPADVAVRQMAPEDWPSVRRIHAEGIATRNATFEVRPIQRDAADRKWLRGHRWVAEVDGRVAGWATVSQVSPRACYSGVVENSIYVSAEFRGRGIGKALIAHQVRAADEDPALWTLQTVIFPENRASLALHRAAGYQAVGLRQRVAQLDGVWRDTVLMERRCRSFSAG